MDLCGQRFSLGDVVNLTFGQSERERVSQRIDDHMDFRGQAAARAAYGLVDAGGQRGFGIICEGLRGR